ncbi:MAG TPA: hypothetical protein VMV86_04025 [Methanosarcinales archaeon]|nr:hypothetical protein [Methanosarcinales archaeon]
MALKKVMSVANGDKDKKRPNSDIKTGDRAQGAGRVYGKSAKATKSTTGTIGGNTPFTYRSNNKTYKYVPGAQNNNPKTGRLL